MEVLAWLVIVTLAFVLIKKYGFVSLLVFTTPIHRIAFHFGFALKPFYIILLVASFSALVERRSPAVFSKLDLMFKLIFFFIASILLSTFLNGANPISFRHIIVFVIAISGSYLVYRKINTVEDIRRLTNVYLSAGLLLGLTGLAFYALYFIRPDLCVLDSIFEGVTYDLDKDWTWPMLQSVDVGSNGYALNLIPFMFISLGSLISAKGFRTKLYAGLVTLLLFSNLFLTFSRGGMVSFFVVIIAMVFLSGKRRMLKFVYISLILVLLPLSFRFLGDYYVAYSTMKGAYSGEGSDLLSSRGELFMSSLNVYLSHPVFGVGQGVISEDIYVGKQAHNTYMELLAENGIIPFLLFCSLLVFLIKKMLYIRKQAQIYDKYYLCMPFVFGMLGLLVAAIPQSAITTTILWLHMAIIIGIYNVIKRA